MVREWRRSGLSVRAFCAEHGLAGTILLFVAAEHRRTCKAISERLPASRTVGNDGADDRPLFVPLRVVPAAAGMAFEVVLGQGRVVRVPACFDPAALRQLLAILEEERPC